MRLLALLLFSITLTVTACNRVSKEEASSKEQESKLSDIDPKEDDPSYAVRKALEAMGGEGKVVEPVDHRKLKDMLDENILGFKRTAYESQTAGAMGFNISFAEAEYEATGDKRIKATISDTGGAGMAVMTMAAWSSMTLDKETQNGWEKTSTYKGYKSFEKYDKTNNTSELAIIIEKRFVVTLDGVNCNVDELKSFADDLNIDELKKMI